MSIRHRLTLLIGLLILAVVAIYGVAAYQAIRSSAAADAGERLSSAAGLLASLVLGPAERMRTQIREAAREPGLQRYLEGGAPGREPAVAALAAPGGSSAGTVIELWDERGRPLPAPGDAPPFADSAVRARVVEAVRARGDAVVGPLVSTGGGIVVPVVAPVRGSDGARVLGHLVRWVPLEVDPATRETIADLIGPGSALYVTNADGDVWTDLRRPVPAAWTDFPGAGGGLASYHTADGRSWFAATVALDDPPWIVAASLPTAQILASARSTLPQLVALGALLLLLAWLGAWGASGGLTRPLSELADAARALGSGELGRRVAEPPVPELAALAQTFNTMASQIQTTHRELERRVLDVTASEARHRTTQERLRRVISSSSAVIYELETAVDQPQLEWISDNLRRVLGYRVGEALEPGWWHACVHPDDRETLGGWIADDAPGRSTRVYRFRHKDGIYRWIRDDQRRVGGRGEGPLAVVGAWLDVTEQQELEVQLRQAQKLEAVGRLAGGVAHDFNNLLTVILAEAQTARNTVVDDSPAARASESVLDAANSAAMLTRQLLAFSRREMVEPTTLDLNEAVHALHRMLRRLVGEDLTLELAPGEGLWPVRADRSQIEQVVANLVVNARDAMPDGGAISIETSNVTLDPSPGEGAVSRAAGDFVRLSVRDTGTGMSDEVKAHLFEPFFTTKGVGKGSGLGLATSYAIVEQLGGHVDVHSEIGQGTTVDLYLPRTSAVVARASTLAPDAVVGGTETVLVVEDEPSVRRVAARILRSHGYTVLEAEDGEHALTLLEGADRPDLILTDLVMPRMGGRDLAARALQRHAGLKVLFMSGYTDDAETRQDLLTREIPFLHKPFDVVELAARVREVLDGT